METKFCKKCNDYLPISEFHNSQNSLLCKFHHNEIGRENKEKYRKDPKNIEKEKLKYQERKIRLWANQLLSYSKGRNCINTLTTEEIIDIYSNQKGLCYWFQIPLLPSLTKKHPQQPSLDRIDRLKGYTKDNVVLSCYAANIGRNETDIETWENFLDVLFKSKNSTELKINKDIISLKKKIEDIGDKDTFVIYNNNLTPIIITNLSQYCRENNISINTIRGARKKIKRIPQKGLIVLNRSKNETITKRVYKLTSPGNIEYSLMSLREFCLKNNLNDSALQRVGKGALKDYKGWKCEYTEIILS